MLHPTIMPVYGCWTQVCRHCSVVRRNTDLNSSLNYTWINQDRKSVQLPAPTYIDYVMTWVQNLLDDENVFPTKSGTCFNPIIRMSPLDRSFRQAGISRQTSPQLSSTSTDSFFGSLRTSIMHTIPRSCICAVKDTSIPSSPTSWPLARSTSFSSPRISRASQVQSSA